MNTQISGKGNSQIQNNNLQEQVVSSYEKETIQLENGKSAITMRGGYLYPIMFKEVLAGEYIKSWSLDNITRLITPLVPTMDRVYINIKAFFVPHTRVWKEAEKALAAKTDLINYTDYEMDLQSIPHETINKDRTKYKPYKETLVARYGLPNDAGDTQINPLLMRGYRAIINDFVINKEYELPKIEWNDSTVTAAEKLALEGYNPTGPDPDGVYRIEAAQTRRSYLTNIKKNIGNNPNDVDPTDSGSGMDETDRTRHLDWQTRFMDLKQRIDNANKNDWDIIAEMGGTQPVTADRTQYLGEIDYELNYQQITQSAPAPDNTISPLGTTGSFSYTRANGELFSHKHFQQHGFVHILVSLSIDKDLEEGTPKELLKNEINDIYRPALAKKEIQFLKKAEIANTNDVTLGETAAFQPAWAEYKRLPRFVTGQMRTKALKDLDEQNPDDISFSQWHNFASEAVSVTVDGNYFRPYFNTAAVLQRNNILMPDDQDSYPEDPIINMSEHKITISTPINAGTLKGKSKAEVTR